MERTLTADILAVQATLARYCHRLDDGDIDGVLALFTPDGVFSYLGATAHGPDELRAFFARSQGTPELRGKHLTVNVDVQVDGDTATSRADFLYLRAGETGPIPQIAGRYEDDLRRIDGEWRIARRLALPLAKLA